MNSITLKVIIENNQKVLLLEDYKGEYHLAEEETEQQDLSKALKKLVMKTTGYEIKKIVRKIRAKEKSLVIFVVEIYDPEDLLLREHKAFAWVDPKEAFGYPIKEDLREILDLYLKLTQS